MTQSTRSTRLTLALGADQPVAPAGPPDLSPGVVHLSEPLARVAIRLALGGVEPLLELDDWTTILACSRRQVETMRAAGKLPPPDLHIGKLPRWRAPTAREWLAKGGER